MGPMPFPSPASTLKKCEDGGSSMAAQYKCTPVYVVENVVAWLTVIIRSEFNDNN